MDGRYPSVDIAETSFRIPSDGRESVRIRTTLPELPKVTGSPEDLLHLFINLLINARHAMTAGGTITVIGAYDGELVRIKVEDEEQGFRQLLSSTSSNHSSRPRDWTDRVWGSRLRGRP